MKNLQLPYADNTAQGIGTVASDVGFDVVLVAGQSNNHYGNGLDLVYDFSHPDIYQYPTTNPSGKTYIGTAIQASEPLLHWQAPAGCIGYCLSFAKWYRMTIPNNRKVLLVPAASPGTGFSTNDWNPGQGLYNNAIQRTNEAIALNPNNRLVAILWHQGEADAMNSWTPAQYKTAFNALFDGFRSSITGAATVPFLVGEMSYTWVGSDSIKLGIQNAIRDLPTRRPYTAVVSANGLLGEADSYIHFLASQQRIFGRRYFDALDTARANISALPVIPSAPINLTFTPSTNGVSVDWTQGGSPLNYTYSYKLSSSSTWATDATTTSKPLSISSLVAATAYDFRILASNSAGSSAYATGSFTTSAAASIPPAPTSLVFTPSANGVSVNWTQGGSPTSYAYSYKLSSSSTWTDSTTSAKPVSIGSLTASTAYDFRVAAVNAAGTSAYTTGSFTTSASSGLPTPLVSMDFLSGYVDTSGNGVTCTPSTANGITIITDSTRGKVANFPAGQNNQIALALALPGTYTKACWFKFAAGGGTYANLMSGDTGNSHVFWFPDSMKITGGQNGSFTAVQDPTLVVAQQWYHAAMTCDATTGAMKIYRNGALVASGTVTTGWAGAASPIRIGAYRDLSDPFYGQISNPKVWGSVLTDAQISTLYNNELL